MGSGVASLHPASARELGADPRPAIVIEGLGLLGLEVLARGGRIRRPVAEFEGGGRRSHRFFCGHGDRITGGGGPGAGEGKEEKDDGEAEREHPQTLLDWSFVSTWTPRHLKQQDLWHDTNFRAGDITATAGAAIGAAVVGPPSVILYDTEINGGANRRRR